MAVVLSLFLAMPFAMARPAVAQTYYLGFSGGYAQAIESELVLTGAPASAAEFDPGGAVAAVFGFESYDGWRLEGELSWRRTGFDTLDGADAVGAIETWATMVNVFYRPNARARVGLYLGGGGGMARVEVAGAVTATGPLDDFDLAPAWQLGAGIEASMFRRTALSIDYRYLVVDGIEWVDNDGDGVGTDQQSNSVMIGLRFGF